jgi:hypothetical protein
VASAFHHASQQCLPPLWSSQKDVRAPYLTKPRGTYPVVRSAAIRPDGGGLGSPMDPRDGGAQAERLYGRRQNAVRGGSRYGISLSIMQIRSGGANAGPNIDFQLRVEKLNSGATCLRKLRYTNQVASLENYSKQLPDSSVSTRHTLCFRAAVPGFHKLDILRKLRIGEAGIAAIVRWL